jgi:hypothetical protein
MTTFPTPMTRAEFWQHFAKLREDLGERLLLHFHYHGQFVEATGVRPSPFILDKCRVAAAQGDDWSLNKVPLHHWDTEAAGTHFKHRVIPALRAVGDCYSLGVAVCILKESARRILAAEGIELPRGK